LRPVHRSDRIGPDSSAKDHFCITIIAVTSLAMPSVGLGGDSDGSMRKGEVRAGARRFRGGRCLCGGVRVDIYTAGLEHSREIWALGLKGNVVFFSDIV
jgi:hypothetical protein